MQVLAVPAAIANYVLGEIQQALGFSGNFLPALAGAILIGLALRALLNVSCCAECMRHRLAFESLLAHRSSRLYYVSAVHVDWLTHDLIAKSNQIIA